VLRYYYLTLNVSEMVKEISQEDVILIKNLYLSKQCGARRLLSELPDKGWKLGTSTVC